MEGAWLSAPPTTSAPQRVKSARRALNPKMCVESDGCEIEGCSSSDEVHTLSGSMSANLKPSADLHPCRPGQKFRAALLRCRSPLVAAGILSFGNVLNYMDRYTVAGKASCTSFT
ncbi:hypothetical protein DNTS_004001 [Danionella cerebrum]|uniref:Uncharacterized protein n=1 Tax=Danionella cerebrum TaxID=2873325 RepID=A0A553RAX5_9TELE|nr:hypothetical protein DNTS_004001 [Danionella translucida]